MKQFLGIEIQTRRYCCYAVINDAGKLVKFGWFLDPKTKVTSLIEDLLEGIIESGTERAHSKFKPRRENVKKEKDRSCRTGEDGEG